jgi:hypothetical protein
MKKETKVAELVFENRRLYIEWFVKGTGGSPYPISKTDITPIWHFIKDNFGILEQYLKQPYDE